MDTTNALQEINITEEELPNVISKRLQNIVDIDKRIQLADEKCEQAKTLAEKQILAKGFKTNDAINSTQDAVKSIADAQASLSDAQKVLFENQQKMAEGMRYLLLLGASSISNSRIVIAQLEGKLKQASQEELSTRARQELMDVIKILRDQESAFSKQERLSSEIKSQSKEIENIHIVDEKQDEADKKHDALIAERIFKDSKQDAEIERQKSIDKEHDKKIKKSSILSWISIGLSIVAIAVSIIAIVL